MTSAKKILLLIVPFMVVSTTENIAGAGKDMTWAPEKCANLMQTAGWFSAIVKDGNKAISGVQVKVYGNGFYKKPRSRPFDSVSSDALGFFKVKLPGKDNVVLAFLKPGYKPLYKVYVRNEMVEVSQIMMQLEQ